MSLGTFINTDVADLIEAADVPDSLLTQTQGDVTTRAVILFDAVDAALIKMGEAGRTDLLTTRVTFSTGGKAVLTRLAQDTTGPLSWTDYHPFTNKAQALIDSLLDPLVDLDSGSFTPVGAVTTTAPDYAGISDKIISQSLAQVTAAIAVARDEIAAALEAFDPLCVPARVGSDYAFSTLCKSILLIMASGTPTVFPTAIFQAKYDALVAAFNAAISNGIAVTADEPA